MEMTVLLTVLSSFSMTICTCHWSTSRMSLSSWQQALGSSRFSRWNFSWSVISGRRISRQSAGTPANTHIYRPAEQLRDHTGPRGICRRHTLREDARSLAPAREAAVRRERRESLRLAVHRPFARLSGYASSRSIVTTGA
ncbi:hypothetical protein EYF80_015887 [Liparis tanakae]|uniref:Secreted protein n=1 Tax=Liparis tanakae TaxID=230148 RepID=A0A4Z2I7Q3_9TELE|nr:hypothetical protein EYF80_015887 [Liparis tanakae]